jgi:hypothetical protein
MATTGPKVGRPHGPEGTRTGQPGPRDRLVLAWLLFEAGGGAGPPVLPMRYVNRGAVYDRFDAVVALSAPLDALLERVADRANPIGSTPWDQAKIASDLAAYEPLLRARGRPGSVTAAAIIDVAAAHRTKRLTHEVALPRGEVVLDQDFRRARAAP